MKLLLTCEHGGNSIPEEFEALFHPKQDVLNAHKGYDLGALDLFEALKKQANYSRANEITRLLIDFNRSTHNPRIFSADAKKLPQEKKEQLLNAYYLPYRRKVVDYVEKIRKTGESTLHISVHSFTPQLNGKVRNADVTFLYDPANSFEKQFARLWRKTLKSINPDMRIRYNYPYFGKSDGFTTYLRKVFPHTYAGIELEVNQAFVAENKLPDWLKIQLGQSLKEARARW